MAFRAKLSGKLQLPLVDTFWKPHPFPSSKRSGNNMKKAKCEVVREEVGDSGADIWAIKGQTKHMWAL